MTATMMITLIVTRTMRAILIVTLNVTTTTTTMKDNDDGYANDDHVGKGYNKNDSINYRQTEDYSDDSHI